jgi:exodeoxyribonuclease VII small subunit
MKYEEAIKRLNDIVQKLEAGGMDVDSLANNLKEAQELVAFCRDQLTRVEADVKKILDEPEAPTAP